MRGHEPRSKIPEISGLAFLLQPASALCFRVSILSDGRSHSLRTDRRNTASILSVTEAILTSGNRPKRSPMLHTLRALRSWPLRFRLVLTAGTLGVFCALQLPLENEVPGHPFLLFSMVVIGSTLTFGERVGFFAVALSTFLSFFFLSLSAP